MVLVERVEPWKRGVETVEAGLATLTNIHQQHHPDEDPSPITQASIWRGSLRAWRQ